MARSLFRTRSVKSLMGRVVSPGKKGTNGPFKPFKLFLDCRERERNYAISPDGKRFLMSKVMGPTEETSAPTQINVVLNWFEELKRLVPTGE